MPILGLGVSILPTPKCIGDLNTKMEKQKALPKPLLHPLPFSKDSGATPGGSERFRHLLPRIQKHKPLYPQMLKTCRPQ